MRSPVDLSCQSINIVCGKWFPVRLNCSVHRAGRKCAFWVIHYTLVFRPAFGCPKMSLRYSRSARQAMRYLIISLLSLIIVTPAPLAADTEQERLANSAEAMEEILNIPDALPHELLNKAECVVVMPSVKKFAIGIGGSYGRG